LGGELDVAENEHGIDFVALHIQKNLSILFHNEPVSGLAQDRILFGEIEVGHGFG